MKSSLLTKKRTQWESSLGTGTRNFRISETQSQIFELKLWKIK